MHLESLVETFNSWWPNEGQDPKCCFLLACASPPPHHAPTLAAIIFYDGSEEQGRKHFKKFFELGPVADMTDSHPYVVQVHPSYIPSRPSWDYCLLLPLCCGQLLI